YSHDELRHVPRLRGRGELAQRAGTILPQFYTRHSWISTGHRAAPISQRPPHRIVEIVHRLTPRPPPRRRPPARRCRPPWPTAPTRAGPFCRPPARLSSSAPSRLGQRPPPTTPQCPSV